MYRNLLLQQLGIIALKSFIDGRAYTEMNSDYLHSWFTKGWEITGGLCICIDPKMNPRKLV